MSKATRPAKPPAVLSPVCPTCGAVAKAQTTRYGVRHACCGLWSWGGKVLVAADVHQARNAAHKAFDVLWKSGAHKRGSCYARLADLMGLSKADCHIALMNADQARRVVELVKAGDLGNDTRDVIVARKIPEGVSSRDRPKPRDVWITVGADCPSSTTPGQRQVHHFHTLQAAHEGGFPWAV